MASPAALGGHLQVLAFAERLAPLGVNDPTAAAIVYGVGKRSKSEPRIISTRPFSHYLQLTFPMISLGLVILHPGTIAGLQILCINNGPINKIGKP